MTNIANQEALIKLIVVPISIASITTAILCWQLTPNNILDYERYIYYSIRDIFKLWLNWLDYSIKFSISHIINPIYDWESWLNLGYAHFSMSNYVWIMTNFSTIDYSVRKLKSLVVYSLILSFFPYFNLKITRLENFQYQWTKK